MSKNSTTSLDVASRLETAVSQFRGLNRNDPGQWPMLPRLAVYAGVAMVVVLLGWFLFVTDLQQQLEDERGREPTFKSDYSNKLTQAVNLSELRKQKLQVQEYVTQLEKQLPGKAEMDALLSDINQAGLGRGLLFELFKPGQVEVKEYYAELPIALKVSGRYHDVGAFAADVANLSRIVTLHNLSIAPAATREPRETGGLLSMEATARTYRYLDPAEVAEQRRAAADKSKDKGPRN
jgi:type IV pilus assembly protein PilO